MAATPRTAFNPKTSGPRSSGLLRRLDNLAAWIECHPWVLLPCLLILYAHIVLHTRTKLLWHDELFTFYIAQAPTFLQMLQWTRQIDLNPPLYYIATRACFHLFHPSSFSVRLPSMLSYCVAALCAYQFIRRRFSPLYGVIAALILLREGYNFYSYEARPYAMVLGFLGIAAIGWQGAIAEGRTKRWLYLLLLGVGGFGMLLSHVLALIAYGAFFFAEGVRLIIRRKTDWPLWVSLLVPLASCLLYLPLIHNYGASAFPPAFQASPQLLFNVYDDLSTKLLPLFALAMVLIALAESKSSVPAEHAERIQILWPEIGLAVSLLLVPSIITLAFMRSHSAFFSRYGMPALFGAAILIPYWLAWWTRMNRRAALIGATVFIFAVLPPASLTRILQRHLHPAPTAVSLTGEIDVPLSKLYPDLPLVDASGLTFLEMNHRENGFFLSRVFYLEDKQADLQYAHATIFEGFSALTHIFPLRAQVVPYSQFTQQHPRFLVLGTYDYPEDWLLRKLIADGATLRFLGDVSSSYNDRELYEVTLKH